MNGKMVHVFPVYASEDASLWRELEKQFTLLQRQGSVTCWDRGKIPAGRDVQQEQEASWQRAQVILLLISPNLLSSDMYGFVEQAIERHQAKSARVVPVLLRPVAWQPAVLAGLSALPANGRPVTTWKQREQALVEIASGLRVVFAEILADQTIASDSGSAQEHSQEAGLPPRLSPTPHASPEQFLAAAEEARVSHIRMKNTLGSGRQGIDLERKATIEDVEMTIEGEKPFS